MNGTVRVLTLTLALLGLTATAEAKNDSHHGKNDRHDERHEPDRHDKHFASLRGSYAFDNHRFDGHDRHDRRGKPDQIEKLNSFWHKTGFFVQSCFKNIWWSIFSRWDDFRHGKMPHKPDHDYKPPHHGKPDHHKPDWNWHKPHNHHHRDKPDYHPPKPDCPEEPPIPVPEPGSLTILGSGLLGAWLLRRRNKTS